MKPYPHQTIVYYPAWRPLPVRHQLTIYGSHPDEHQQRQLSRGRFYEQDLLDYLGFICPAPGVFIDCGANIGNHTLFFSECLSRRVVAVEPSPLALEILELNLGVNGIENVTVIPSALSNQPGTGRLQKAVAGNIGTSRLVKVEQSESGANGTIQITTLDRIWESLPITTRQQGCSLIKLDLEGSELPALKGATSLLTTERPQILAEAVNEAERSRLRSFLAQYGYTEVAKFGVTPIYHYVILSFHKSSESRDWSRWIHHRAFRAWWHEPQSSWYQRLHRLGHRAFRRLISSLANSRE